MSGLIFLTYQLIKSNLGTQCQVENFFLRCAGNYAAIKSISTNYLGTHVMLTGLSPSWGWQSREPFQAVSCITLLRFQTHFLDAHIYAKEGNEVASYRGCKGLWDDESIGN